MVTARAYARTLRMLDHPDVEQLDVEQRLALEGLAALLEDVNDRHEARSMAFAYLCGYGADLSTFRAVSAAL